MIPSTHAKAPLLFDNGTILLDGERSSTLDAYYAPRNPMNPRPGIVANIPEKVETADAVAALGRVRSLSRYGRFADSERIVTPEGFEETDLTKPPGQDESCNLVMQMTSVCRPSLEVAPAFAVVGPRFRGSAIGKTHLINLTCALAYGRAPRVVSLGRDEAEQEKRLIGAYLEGAPAILFDNNNEMTFRSDTFAAITTTGYCRARKLGGSDYFAIHARAMAFFAGNDLTFGAGLAGNILVVRLDSRTESPGPGRFPSGSLESLLSQRERHLSDVLTIWRWGYQNDKALAYGRPLAGFEKWSRWCRDPLLALGCQDPIERMNETDAAPCGPVC